ncbi:MAG TPA: heme exporter protein CcmD [Ramlibacter sp.]|jgi:heme exporter protein D
MNWGSPREFFAMGGYALYVWGSFGLTLFAFCVEYLVVRHRRCAIVDSLKRQAMAARLDQEMA